MKGAIRISPLHCNRVDEIELFLEISTKNRRKKRCLIVK